jgi:hypothetical protein
VQHGHFPNLAKTWAVSGRGETGLVSRWVRGWGQDLLSLLGKGYNLKMLLFERIKLVTTAQSLKFFASVHLYSLTPGATGWVHDSVDNRDLK